MIFGWFDDAINNVKIIDLIVAFVLVVLVAFACYRRERGYRHFILFAVLFILLVVTFALNYSLSFAIVEILLLISTLGYLTTSFGELSRLLEKIGKKFQSKKQISSHQRTYEIINDAVLALSESKTGAIITLEKGENLEEYCKKGVKVDAPVSAELLRTIFYVGTPLHDGAVIIRDDRIDAASVYYTPTTQPFQGHFGARHRAAVGFSESHSSITVIVSEETGRISFAVEGELISISRDAFLRRLVDYMR